MNDDILARYGANRLRVIRQVRYSQQNENSIDLVLFLNGIPVATVEMKTDFTQSIKDAIDQYYSIGLLDYITRGGSYGSQLCNDHDSLEGDIS